MWDLRHSWKRTRSTKTNLAVAISSILKGKKRAKARLGLCFLAKKIRKRAMMRYLAFGFGDDDFSDSYDGKELLVIEASLVGDSFDSWIVDSGTTNPNCFSSTGVRGN